MKISALINTRNEAANLAECLDLVAWADEVVVADQASTDGTRDIAKTKGARLVDMPWSPVGNVEIIRNTAIAQCEGDWVLIVDADERVPAKLAARLGELPDKTDAAAFGLPRRNYFLGVWLEHGFWPDHQVRFFRKGTVSWSATVHEPPKVEGRLELLPAEADAALEHPGYANDLGGFIEKLARYSRFEGERLATTLKPSVWPYMVRRPLGEFYGRYITAQAWRYGMHGFAWSALMAVYQLHAAMHYWSLQKRPADSPAQAGELRRNVRWEALRANSKWLRF
ncbi:MAG: glycosyltransferase family 2 protein [Verrucomicrobiota bacterium]